MSILKVFQIFLLFSIYNIGYLSAQTKLKYESVNDSSSVSILETKEVLEWANSFLLAVGYGYPQGMRFDGGYNFGEYISFGVTINSKDFWTGVQSKRPKAGIAKGGIFVKISWPLATQNWTPYIYYNSGSIYPFGERDVKNLSTGEIVGQANDEDKYDLFYFGAMVPIRSWLHVRPEIGIVFTSKAISQFGDPKQVSEKNKTIGLNLSFEFDF